MDTSILSFIMDHFWAPVLGLGGWIGNRYITKTDEELSMLSSRMDKQADYINDKVVKKDDLAVLTDQVTYLRDRMDKHVDSILQKIDEMTERRSKPR